jgi:hypothetical protein
MELTEAIDWLTAVQSSRPRRECKLFVKVLNPGSVGGTPCVEVTQVNAGFDWDAGKVLLSTDAPLTRLTPEDVAAIHKSAKESQSWHAFQSYKKQAARIKELEDDLAAARAKLPGATNS